MRQTIAVVLSFAMPAMAEDFSLALPIDCNLGKDCFIQQYVDQNPGPEAVDFTCGPLSYDGHKGTDFALHDLRAMTDGVAVLAAAEGYVRAIRDGEPDTGAAQAASGKDCGNGVLLEHSAGWATQYCHLKRDSILVSEGDYVTTGAVLGEVGLSGRSEFPHLHISVRRDDAVIDPFAPDAPGTCGQTDGSTLWQTDIPYTPGGVISLGLADSIPTFDAIKAGQMPELAPAIQTEALVLYAHLFGTRAGDLLVIRLVGPRGTVFASEIVLEQTQARSFRALGKRRPDTGWVVGQYTGTATLLRDEEIVSDIKLDFDLR